MANKTSKSSSKSRRGTRKPTRKPKSGSASAGRKPGKRTGGKKPTPPKKPARGKKPPPKQQPVREGLSLDRKLDIIGVVLTLVGVLTLLSYLSANKSDLTGGWASVLGQVFGVGMYVFPFGLITGGLWLVLRNFESVPKLEAERILGVILLFANLLAFVHFFNMLRTESSALDLAQEGAGGGYVGAFGAGFLNAALGMGGAAIVLIAWLLISLTLVMDITVVQMVGWFPPLMNRLSDWAIETWESYRPFGGRQEGIPNYPAYTPPAAGAGSEYEGPPAVLPGAAPYAVTHPSWVLPPIDQILDVGGEVNYDDEFDLQRARLIEETLNSFGAPARVVEINRGPTITQFGVEPDYVESRSGRMRVRVSKITALADDLALALAARTIRIQAPVPGKGFVGVEVPNEEIALVALRDVIENQAFKNLKSPLRFALGQNVSGHAVAADLAVMPHLLIAGATGSGKSVCVNSLITCLLMHNTPNDLRLLMVDPKRVELSGYNGIPHLLAPVVVELERVVIALQWVAREMDMRYHKLAEAGCRNIQDYNARREAGGGQKLPYLVVIIDELADLMMLAPDETERTVTRLAQLARATGIHLVIATQRPSTDVVTGLIKANFPARIAFAVASGVDSRVILDQPGAERLLGRGDMLFQAPDAPAPVRLQGVFVSENEIMSLVNYWQSFTGLVQPASTAAGGVIDGMPTSLPLKQMPMWEDLEEEQNSDPLMSEAIDLVRRQGRASISMLQRRLRIGYTRAARLIEAMEEKEIVGPPDPGTGTREVLDYGPAAPPVGED
jgi:S-DNA-T family DNA segregation ATPase FtsK/SpoIIIE